MKREGGKKEKKRTRKDDTWKGGRGGRYEGKGSACAGRGRLIVTSGLAESCLTGPVTNSMP
jgi:hypothetical protein